MLELTSAQLLTTLGLGLMLGIKHASDSDHIVAVSTIVSEHKSLLKSSLIGMFWGIGHTITLLLVGLVILILKLTIPEKIALSMELLVGIMLIVLGISVSWNFILKHLHAHNHHAKTHTHIHSHKNDHAHEHKLKPEHKSIIVGMIHGLAGSAALMLLVLTTLDTTLQGLLYIFVFGIGSILGMMTISFIICMPFVISKNFEVFNQKIKIVAGIISISLGISIVRSIVLI